MRVGPFGNGLREAENWDEPGDVIPSHPTVGTMVLCSDCLSRADTPIPQLLGVSLLMAHSRIFTEACCLQQGLSIAPPRDSPWANGWLVWGHPGPASRIS